MHEFSSVNEAINIIRQIQPQPKKVRITLGKMRGSSKTFETMFREQVSETPLSGIHIEIVQTLAEVKCSCGFEGNVRVMGHVHFVRCPLCNDVADIIKGNELEITPID